MASPQAFEYVTDAHVLNDAWESDGLVQVRSVLEDALNTQDNKKAQQVVYEACWRVVRGEVASREMVNLFVKHEGDGHGDALVTILADVCWILGLEVDHFEADDEKQMSREWKHLCSLVTSLTTPSGRDASSKEAIVPQSIMMQRLELDLLEGAGLGDAKVMQKRLVKANTNNLYRQTKYNMLLEESEGFAKLVTELGTCGEHNVEAVKRNIQSLVGYFHLDPNRVCDIVLDAWEVDLTNGGYNGLLSLFRSSNLSQMIGFKFQMYGRDQIKDPTPTSLYWFATVLLSAGTLDMEDIRPHLSPALSDLQTQRDTEIQRLEEEGKGVGRVSLTSGTANAMSGGTSKKEAAAEAEKKKTEEKEADVIEKEAEKSVDEQHAANQHFNLIAGMLDLRAWEMAKKNCSRYNALGLDYAADHPAVLASLFRLLSEVIEPLYTKISLKSLGVMNVSGVVHPPSPNETLRQELISSLPSTLDPVHTYENLLLSVGPVLTLIGHRISSDIVLFTKVVRLLADMMRNQAAVVGKNTDKNSSQAKSRAMLLRIMSGTLLPALSLVDHANPSLVALIWEVLGEFPFKTRFDMYEVWRSRAYETVPALILAKIKDGHQTRQVLKRMANERDSMRMAGRNFSKVAHGSPLVAFTQLLNNIQAYDNLIPTVVDAIKYLTPLAFDCLAYLVVVYLSKDDSKLKSDGATHSQWLNALCKFAGHLYHKYPTVELGGLWHYLAGQLMINSPLELLALEEIVSKMSGIEVVVDFSETTLRATGGGETLRERSRLAMGTNVVVRKKPILLLKESFEKADILLPMLMLLAHQREATIFESESKHLKLIGHLYDKCTSILIQFVEFLSVHMGRAAYATMVPSLVEMNSKYFLEPVVSFHIARRAIRHAHSRLQDAKEELNKAQGKGGGAASREVVSKEAKAKAIGDAEKVVDTLSQSRWVMGSPAMLNDVSSLCGPSVWKAISPDMYTTFWCLSLYDIFTPRTEYDNEIALVQSRHDKLTRGEEVLTVRKRKSETDKCVATVANLKLELSEQINNHNIVLDRLRSTKDKWFPVELNRKAAVREFLQSCILPRALFSAEDALFCAKFVQVLHSLGTPGFSTVNFFDKLARNFMTCIFCVTEREASNFAVYLNESLSLLLKWRNDKKTYAKECESRPGFSTSFVDTSKKIKYSQFVDVHDRWHDRIGRVFLTALGSDNYMHVRQALIVCSRIVGVYPNTVRVADLLAKKAGALAKSDDRQDLRTMAMRYEAMLKKQIKGGKLRETPASSKTVKASKSASSAAAKSSNTSNGAKKTTAKPNNTKSTDTNEDDGEIKEVTSTSTNNNISSSKQSSKSSSTSTKPDVKLEERKSVSTFNRAADLPPPRRSTGNVSGGTGDRNGDRSNGRNGSIADVGARGRTENRSGTGGRDRTESRDSRGGGDRNDQRGHGREQRTDIRGGRDVGMESGSRKRVLSDREGNTGISSSSAEKRSAVDLEKIPKLEGRGSSSSDGNANKSQKRRRGESSNSPPPKKRTASTSEHNNAPTPLLPSSSSTRSHNEGRNDSRNMRGGGADESRGNSGGPRGRGRGRGGGRRGGGNSDRNSSNKSRGEGGRGDRGGDGGGRRGGGASGDDKRAARTARFQSRR